MARVSKKSLTLTVLFTYYMKGLEEEKMEDDKEKKQEKTVWNSFAGSRFIVWQCIASGCGEPGCDPEIQESSRADVSAFGQLSGLWMRKKCGI